MGVYKYLSNLWISLFLYSEATTTDFFSLLSEWNDTVFQLTGVRAGDFIEDQSSVPLQAPPPLWGAAASSETTSNPVKETKT